MRNTCFAPPACAELRLHKQINRSQPICPAFFITAWEYRIFHTPRQSGRSMPEGENDQDTHQSLSICLLVCQTYVHPAKPRGSPIATRLLPRPGSGASVSVESDILGQEPLFS